MAEVVLENVSRFYPGGTLAVDSLNLRIHDRELLVLLGPSGCGKSTTLRMVAGLEKVDAGEIWIGSRRANDLPPRDRDIAMVFQNYALYPHMTVARNMAFGLERRYGGWWPARLWRRVWSPARAAELESRRREIPRQVSQVARSLGIEHLLGRLPRQLSGGERQRVALGRAIVRQPAAFLFDEPLSNLDARLRTETRRELKQLHQRLEATILYVTHDQVEALTLGDRIAVMDRGVLQQVDTPLEVYNHPRNRFVAGFLGTPTMNFLEGELAAQEGRLVFRGAGIVQLVESRLAGGRSAGRVTLGVRPEHVRLFAEPSEIEKATQENAVRRGRVTVVESLGDASLVYVTTAGYGAAEEEAGKGIEGVTLSSKVGSQVAARVGQEVRFQLDPAHIHLFDGASGANLASSGSA